jgi:hypothetical protein
MSLLIFDFDFRCSRRGSVSFNDTLVEIVTGDTSMNENTEKNNAVEEAVDETDIDE